MPSGFGGGRIAREDDEVKQEAERVCRVAADASRRAVSTSRRAVVLGRPFAVDPRGSSRGRDRAHRRGALELRLPKSPASSTSAPLRHLAVTLAMEIPAPAVAVDLSPGAWRCAKTTAGSARGPRPLRAPPHGRARPLASTCGEHPPSWTGRRSLKSPRVLDSSPICPLPARRTLGETRATLRSVHGPARRDTIGG